MRNLREKQKTEQPPGVLPDGFLPGIFYVVPPRPREIPREKFGSVLPKETVISAVGHCANRARADINMTYTVRTASVDLGEKIC